MFNCCRRELPSCTMLDTKRSGQSECHQHFLYLGRYSSGYRRLRYIGKITDVRLILALTLGSTASWFQAVFCSERGSLPGRV